MISLKKKNNQINDVRFLAVIWPFSSPSGTSFKDGISTLCAAILILLCHSSTTWPLACVCRVTGDSGGLSPVLRRVCADANTSHPPYRALNHFLWLCCSRCEWVISKHIEKAKSMHPLAFCHIVFVYGGRLVHQRSFNTAGASRISASTGTPKWFL